MSSLLLLATNMNWIPWVSSLAGLVLALVVLYFVGRKMQKKQDEQQQLMETHKQSMNMLIIDKKKVRFKDAGFPQSVIDQTPKMARRMKVYAVKVKVGPQLTTLICDAKVYDTIPVKKEVKAVVSGLYILSVKGLHGKTELQAPKKKNFFKRSVEKLQEKAGAKPLK